MAFFKAKVPVAIATGIICLLIGGGLGAAIMSYTLGDPKPAAAGAGAAPDEEGKGDPKAGGDAKGAKGGKGGFGGGKGGGKGGGLPGPGPAPRGPNPKVQLTQLVGKLDTLTGQPLHITLTPDQKKQAKELLAGLAEKEELTDDEAKAKLDALLKLVEANKKTLEDAGYRWPGAPGAGGMGGMGGMAIVGGAAGVGGPPAPPPGPSNPFKAGEGADHLKSLQTTLGK